MTERTPALPFYGKDYYDDERVWLASLAAQGLYIALLWHQWQEGSIPSDVRKVAALVGKPEREVRDLWEGEVSQFFVQMTDNRLANTHLEKVRDDVLSLRKSRSKDRQKTSNRPYKIPASDHPSTEGAGEDEDVSGSEATDFESIWADLVIHRIPEPVGKKAARNHFLASVHSPRDLADLRVALANYRAADRVKRGFVQNASTWFNNWRDWIPAPHILSDQERRLARVDELREAGGALKTALAAHDHGSPWGEDFAPEEARTYLAELVNEHGLIRPDAPTFDEWRKRKRGAA
jgi:hypothetical protein